MAGRTFAHSHPAYRWARQHRPAEVAQDYRRLVRQRNFAAHPTDEKPTTDGKLHSDEMPPTHGKLFTDEMPVTHDQQFEDEESHEGAPPMHDKQLEDEVPPTHDKQHEDAMPPMHDMQFDDEMRHKDEKPPMQDKQLEAERPHMHDKQHKDEMPPAHVMQLDGEKRHIDEKVSYGSRIARVSRIGWGGFEGEVRILYDEEDSNDWRSGRWVRSEACCVRKCRCGLLMAEAPCNGFACDDCHCRIPPSSAFLCTDECCRHNYGICRACALPRDAG